MRHDVTPVTSRIANRQKDRFVLAARLGEGFFAPGIPIDRIVRMLEKIGRFFLRQSICVLCVSR